MHSVDWRMSQIEQKVNLALAAQLPLDIPDNVLDFITEFRPKIGRTPLTFNHAPFWIEPMMDECPDIMFINGRQTFKTTNSSSLIAWIALFKPGCEVTWVADDENHRGAFSEKRLREETFLANPKLEQFLPHGQANVGRIRLLNGSTIYLVTDENKYHAVEGHSNEVLVLDEAQAQDIGFLPVAMYSLSKTHGRLYIFGIGGEAGSPYEKRWRRTDQREWIYNDKNWRDKLEFDAFGNITNVPDEMEKILAGRWVKQNPNASGEQHGYHFPQEIFPHIPLTIDDAIHKYRVQPELAIEYQEKHYPHSMVLSHCYGEFFKAERRPITPDMVEACYVNDLKLLKAYEVRELKEIYQDEILVTGGVDYGSGPSASQTVGSVLIHWRKSKRVQLAWIDRRPQEHQLYQARYLAEMFADYGIDCGVGDLGYGAIQIKLMQEGGRDDKDIKFKGLGVHRFLGCRTVGDETKPEMDFRRETDEHGTQTGRLQIDKTTVIQNFVDFIGMKVSHPLYPESLEKQRPIFMIPHMNDWETDFLMDDFCDVTRKDLEEEQQVRVEDPRQRARKEYNHPPDSVMSIIYNLVSAQNFRPSQYMITPVKRSPKKW